MRFGFSMLFVAVAAFLAAPAAVAQEHPFSEIRLGVMAHNADDPAPAGHAFNLTQIEDVNFELLFHAPEIDAFRWIGSPRPRIGGTINLDGQESMVNLGLTWHIPVFETPFFIEGTFGGAIHDGSATSAGAPAPLRDLGCRVLFYEAASLGVNIGDNATLMATIEHASHANLCGGNRGLTNLGLRAGWRF